MINYGFMQGRLSNLVDGRIQAFPWDNWRNEFNLASDLGFSAIEWTLDAERLHENPLITTDGQSEIRDLSNKYGVKVTSVTGDCFMQKPFWKLKNRHEKDNLISDFIKVIDACSIMEIDKIIVPLVDNGKLTDQNEELLFLKEIKRLRQYLRKRNVKLLFETDFSPARNKNFICGLPHDIFGLNYDTGNSASLGYQVLEEFRLFSDRIKNIHIKDRKLNGGSVPLGQGHADFRQILKCIINSNYKGNLIFQTARSSDGDHAKALIKYREFINNILEELCN